MMPAPTMPCPPMPEPVPTRTPRAVNRRLKPGVTVSPDIELFTSDDGVSFMALLRYNRTRTWTEVRTSRDAAYDAAFQFYLEHTATGREASEPVDRTGNSG